MVGHGKNPYPSGGKIFGNGPLEDSIESKTLGHLHRPKRGDFHHVVFPDLVSELSGGLSSSRFHQSRFLCLAAFSRCVLWSSFLRFSFGFPDETWSFCDRG